ncbi:hypothetical protein Tco_1301403 [Tanacetum coccineum]
MSSESTSSRTPRCLLTPSSKVKFQHHKSNVAYNNAIALLEYHEPLFQPMLSFLSNCSICTVSRTFGTPHNKSAVPLPPKGIVRAGLATLGLVDKDKPSLTSTEHTPSASEVSLTSHMLKVAKISKEPDESLILPSKEVNAEATADKSYLEASVTIEVQDNQLKAANTTDVPEKIVEKEEVAEEQTLEIPTVAELLDEVNKAAQETPESPYDTESKIKVVKSFFTSHLSEVQDQTMNDYEESAAADSDDTNDNEVSHSAHTSHDIASVERLSIPDHLDYISMITNALKEQLPGILLATLKDCLPLIVNESLQTYHPAISEQFAETQAQLNKKVVKQLNRQFNISHVAQSNRFVTL